MLGGNAEGILRQRDKLKITDQSEALFKQKRWFKTKKTTALHQGWKWICQENFIDSWITPHVVKPFIETPRFFYAFFVTYIKGNVRQLKDDSC